MLSGKQKRFLRQLYIYRQSIKDIESQSTNGENFYIPEFDQIYQAMVEGIEKLGFSVKMVSPKKANCMIRVFKANSTDNQLQVDLYGAIFCVKNFFSWIYEFESDISVINPRSFQVTIWLTQDDSIIIDTEFNDIYLLVKKKK